MLRRTAKNWPVEFLTKKSAYTRCRGLLRGSRGSGTVQASCTQNSHKTLRGSLTKQEGLGAPLFDVI